MRLFLNVLFRLEAVFASLAYVVVLGAMMAGIIAREFFGISFLYTNKIALFGAIFAGMVGLGLATASGNHIRPKFTDGWMPENWQSTLKRLGDVISGCVFCVAGYISALLVQSSYEVEFLVPVVDWPLWWFQLIMPYAFFSNALRHFAFAIMPSLKPEEEMME
ncbi:TRAP transporter small permease [Pseudovibrio sp. Tun.PSC04-5.I4]|uniref:TRAP transporter small permease n=1 Tax=Pseudovibrio sp. Tun.PSC04-5.I4 TaxID=1798213 RepID=UPI00088A9B10|nr:TRAP transporter small permease [Pseudovibrio sp. Tun.PSC04-5.I4]SDQ96665.1 TRAP-type C4-dicarboxylate transport system, small permease component [Pseudovibrio sp. Tun.PSC04-5.I4]